MAYIRFTDAKVRALKEPGVYRDDKVRGLFVEVNALTASYKVQATQRKGVEEPRSIRRTLGKTTDYTIDQARRWAEETLGAIRRGDFGLAAQSETPTLRVAYEAFAASRKRRGLDPVHTANILANAEKHLRDWMNLRVDQITRPMVVARHTAIGHPYAANHTIKQLRAVLNAADVKDNPVRRITWFTTEPVKNPDINLRTWWTAVAALPNPVRRNLHQLALLSGMRYGHLTEVRREWVDLLNLRINFPKLKRGKPFALPLSLPMARIVGDAMALGDSPFLFWADSSAGHVVDWREDDIETGHCIRRLYISLAATTSLPQHHREWLVDHTPSGMHGHYQDQDVVFPALYEAQTQITKLIMEKAGVAEKY